MDNTLDDVIYMINPIETPLITEFNSAELTIIRFSGYSKKVSDGFKAIHKKMAKPIYYEWVTDTLTS